MYSIRLLSGALNNEHNMFLLEDVHKCRGANTRLDQKLLMNNALNLSTTRQKNNFWSGISYPNWVSSRHHPAYPNLIWSPYVWHVPISCLEHVLIWWRRSIVAHRKLKVKAIALFCSNGAKIRSKFWPASFCAVSEFHALRKRSW